MIQKLSPGQLAGRATGAGPWLSPTGEGLRTSLPPQGGGRPDARFTCSERPSAPVGAGPGPSWWQSGAPTRDAGAAAFPQRPPLSPTGDGAGPTADHHPPPTAALTRRSGCCLRGQSSGHSPAEPRTDRAPGSSPGSCPPSRRLLRPACSWPPRLAGSGPCGERLPCTRHPPSGGQAGVCLPSKERTPFTLKLRASRGGAPFRGDALHFKTGEEMAVCRPQCQRFTHQHPRPSAD